MIRMKRIDIFIAFFIKLYSVYDVSFEKLCYTVQKGRSDGLSRVITKKKEEKGLGYVTGSI